MNVDDIRAARSEVERAAEAIRRSDVDHALRLLLRADWRLRILEAEARKPAA